MCSSSTLTLLRPRAPTGRCKWVHLHPSGCKFLFLQNTIHTQSLTQRRRHRLFSTEWNTTPGDGVPQVETRQICPSTLLLASEFEPPWKNSCGRPWIRPSVTSSLKFADRYISQSCPASLEQTHASIATTRPIWPILRTRQKPLTLLHHTMSCTMYISLQLFHSKLKTLLFNKSYPDSSSSPYLPPRLNSKHHPP